MLTLKSIIFILSPILLVALILIKKDHYTSTNSFWEKQIWKCSDILLIVLCISLLQSVALILGKLKIVKYYYIFVFGNFFSLLTIGGVLFCLIRFKYRTNFRVLGLDREKATNNISIGIVSFFLYALFVIAVFFIIDRESVIYNRAQLFIDLRLNQWPFFDSFVYISGLVILAPLVEECVFRGLMYSPFQKKIGESGSICLTSALWSLNHLQFKSLLSVFLLGVFLCYLYKRTKSLIPGIVFHCMTNVVNLSIYGYLILRGGH